MANRTNYANAPLINDGFGPQLTGTESVAQFFDNKDTMYLTEEGLKERTIREDIDPELLRKIRDAGILPGN